VTERAADKRVMRTKQLIRNALTELMKEKGFDGITVRDLTEKAQINRGTFYLHYQDKYDLLEQSEEEMLAEIATIVQSINPHDAISYTGQNEPFPIILRLFEYFQANADFMTVILGPNGDPAFQVKLKDFIKSTFLRIISAQVPPEEMLVPIDFLSSYLSSAHLGVIQYWLESGMKKTPSEVTLILAKMSLLGPGYVAGLKRNSE